MTAAAHHVIYGRSEELAVIERFVSSAERPAALIIGGDAGIGKTTLWDAAVDLARERGERVLRCRPAQSETQLAFSAVGDLMGDVADEALTELPPPQRRALAVALQRLDPQGEPPEPAAIAAGFAGAVRGLAQSAPLVLAIDDVQWVDASSRALLEFAARRLGDTPVCLLVASRANSGAQTPLGLDRALGHRNVAELEVGPLTRDASRGLLQARLDFEPSPRVLHRIHDAAGGNPFHVLEIGRALLRHSAPLEPGDPLPIPEALQELVRERLDVLAPGTQDMLVVVAALSSPTIETVEAAGGGPAIDEAIRAGVLEADQEGRLRFTHPLLASTAYARAGPRARQALHLRLADLLPGEERARHLALGTSDRSAEAAAELQAAARQAAARGAVAAAAELAEQAVRLTPPEDTRELTERRLDVADYANRNGEHEHVRIVLRPLLGELEPGPQRAEVLLRMALLELGGPEEGLRLCRQAIEEAGPVSVVPARAHRLAAELAMLSGDGTAALSHARAAVEIAEAAGDPATLVEALGSLCHFETFTGSITPGLLERALETERRSGVHIHAFSPREVFGLRLMYADRLDEARAVMRECLARDEEPGGELNRVSILYHLTQLECRAGRLAEAERYGAGVALSHDETNWVRLMERIATASVAAHVGRVDAARAAAEEGALLAADGGHELVRVLCAWILGFLELALGDAPAADGHLRALPAALEAMAYRNPGVRPVYADAIEAQIGVGDLDVDAAIDELEERGRALDNPWARAAAARCRGLLLAARGDSDAAIAELERALVEHERSQQPLERGRTLLALGAAQRRSRQRGPARETLGQALELFDSLGAALWAERAAAELARIPGRRPASDELTETERRIAGLVAEGRSNKEVAAALFVTVRTVEANLSKVYAKLGVRSRTELAHRLARDESS